MNPLLLLKPSYIFAAVPGSEFLFFWPLCIFYLIAFIVSFKVNTWIVHMPHPKIAYGLLCGIAPRLREFALAGIVFAFFRDQNIPWLGMRFWTLALFVLAAVYGIYTWKNFQTNFHKSLMAEKRKQAANFYKKIEKKKAKR